MKHSARICQRTFEELQKAGNRRWTMEVLRAKAKEVCEQEITEATPALVDRSLGSLFRSFLKKSEEGAELRLQRYLPHINPPPKCICYERGDGRYEWVEFSGASGQDVLRHRDLLLKKESEGHRKGEEMDEWIKLLSTTGLFDHPSMTVTEALGKVNPEGRRDHASVV